MRAQVFQLAGLFAGLLIVVWAATITFELQDQAIHYLRVNSVYSFKMETKQTEAEKKCSLSDACPAESYPFHIWSGAANVVGPKICFNGRIIMSHVLNNVGPGINMVQINEETGYVDKDGFLNMESGDPDYILSYLKDIKPGFIVLVASFSDVSPKLTTEMMDIFEEMGSSMIRSAKAHDNWVFVGKTKAKEKSIFEKLVQNDPNNNLYEDWPRVAEVGGCIMKSPPGGQPQAPEGEEKL